MPRPHVEAVALLASAGFRFPEETAPTRRRWRKPMAADIRFALIPSDSPHAKPKAFPDIDGLARCVQRERGLDGLEMVEIDDLEFQGSAAPCRGVQIWTTDAGNDRDRMLGFAWMDGRGMEALKAALRRNRLVIIDAEAA